MTSYGTIRQHDTIPNDLQLREAEHIDDEGQTYYVYHYDDPTKSDYDRFMIEGRVARMGRRENVGSFTAAPLELPLKDNDQELLPLHTGRSFLITDFYGASVAKVLTSGDEKKTGLFCRVSHQIQILRTENDKEKIGEVHEESCYGCLPRYTVMSQFGRSYKVRPRLCCRFPCANCPWYTFHIYHANRQDGVRSLGTISVGKISFPADASNDERSCLIGVQLLIDTFGIQVKPPKATIIVRPRNSSDDEVN